MHNYLVCVLGALLHARFSVVGPIPFVCSCRIVSLASVYVYHQCTYAGQPVYFRVCVHKYTATELG